jgi:expansin (peptidoglycan-binding protein)
VIIVCRTEEKCVFVRVVDSCAGCAKGSKHVDLTKGAFAELADLSEGIVTVAMRLATQPLDW